MRTPVIECRQLPANVGETDGDPFSLGLYYLAGCGGLGDAAQLNPLCHSNSCFHATGFGETRGQMLKSYKEPPMPRPSSKSVKHPQQPQTIEGKWLLKAVGLVIGVALVCTYITLCLIFYRGQWQEVLHPTRSSTSPASANLIRFAPGPSAQPQLAGEWLPAPADRHYRQLTVLLLPSGDGDRQSLSSTQTTLQQFGLNVFVFDYRGYGQSVNLHPSQQSMTEDSESALRYLTETRRISASSILPYGVGVGASLATYLVRSHPEIPAVILDSPYTDLRAVVQNEPRLRFLPVGLLFKEDFPLTEPLATLARPKLLIATGGGAVPASFQTAADPKILVSLPTRSGPLFDRAFTRFFDQYVTVSSPAPSSIKLP